MGQSGSWGLAAKVGGKNSLDAVKQWFLSGIVTKDEYANTLCQERYSEMKSDDRDRAETFYQHQHYSSLIAEGLLCPFKSNEYRLLLT